RVAPLRRLVPHGLHVVTLAASFERGEEQESRERRIGQERLAERGNSLLVLVKIPTERVPPGGLEYRLGAAEQLRVLQLLLAEAEERAQVGAVGVPVLLRDAGEVDGDELFVVAEHVNVAERSDMAQRSLVPLIEEGEMLGAHPRARDDPLRRIEPAI